MHAPWLVIESCKDNLQIDPRRRFCTRGIDAWLEQSLKTTVWGLVDIWCLIDLITSLWPPLIDVSSPSTTYEVPKTKWSERDDKAYLTIFVYDCINNITNQKLFIGLYAYSRTIIHQLNTFTTENVSCFQQTKKSSNVRSLPKSNGQEKCQKAVEELLSKASQLKRSFWIVRPSLTSWWSTSICLLH